MNNDELRSELQSCIEEFKKSGNYREGKSIATMLLGLRNMLSDRRAYGRGYMKESIRYYLDYCKEFTILITRISNLPSEKLNLDSLKDLCDTMYAENCLNELHLDVLLNKNTSGVIVSGNLKLNDSSKYCTIATFAFGTFGPFVTVSCRQNTFPADNLMAIEGGRDLYVKHLKECIDKIVEVAGDRLVLFSDASSSRTFSLFEKSLGEGYFKRIVSGVRNPNTNNLMDVATVEKSLERFSQSVESNREVSVGLLGGNNSFFAGFVGLCGGEVAVAENKDSTVRGFSEKKRGVFPVFYIEDMEGLSEKYVPIFEGTKNAFIYTK